MGQRRIKILFLIDKLMAGGTEKQLLLLAKGLPRNRFETVIGVLEKSELPGLLNPGTEIVEFKTGGLPLIRNVALLMRIKRYIEKGGFDIVQTFFVDSAIYGSLAVRLCKRRPVLVGTRRNLYHWTGESPWGFRLYKFVSRLADHILVNSNEAGEQCMEVEGIAGDRITVIQNAVDVAKFNSVTPEAAKKMLGLNGEYPVIGVVANWRPVKGLNSFLIAASQVSMVYPDARFVLAGHGPQKRELTRFADELGIGGRVRFVENAWDMHKIMPAFDVAVQPSLSESFSNVLVEYMAAGRPVVATRVGDADDVIKDGRDGVLVEPDSPEQLGRAVIELCREPRLAAEMGRLALKKVEERWGVDHIIGLHQEFYGGLIDRSSRQDGREG